MSTWTSRSRSARISSSCPSCVSFEKATITRSTSRQRDDLGQLGRGAEDVRCSRSARRGLGCVSTKPTRLMPYSGCWRSLRPMQLSDVAGADDDGVLHERWACAASARRASASVTKAMRESPEDHGCARRVSALTRPRGTEKPEAPTVTDVEHADDVVGGRVARALLVVVVEAVELREHDAHDRPERIPRRLDAHRLGHGDPDDDPQHVGDQQHAAHQPAASPVRRAAGELLPQLDREGSLSGALSRRRRERRCVSARRPDSDVGRCARPPAGQLPELHPRLVPLTSPPTRMTLLAPATRRLSSATAFGPSPPPRLSVALARLPCRSHLETSSTHHKGWIASRQV